MSRLVAISEVAELNPGFPRISNFAPDSLVSFLPMAAVSESGEIISQDERPFGEVSKGYTYFAEGDVLMAKITPCMENGKATFIQKLKHPAGFGSTEFHVLRPGSEIDGKYLFYMIWNPLFRKIAERNMTGTAGQKRVPSSFLKDSQIPLPPLLEQKRIAAILDKADSIRRKRQEAVRLTEEMLRSVFLDMFGDPVTNLKGWSFRNLGDVCDVRDGTHDSPKYVSEGGYALVTSKNLTGGTVDLSDVNFISEADYAQINKRSRVDRGDIIMPMIGTIGSPVLVDQEPNYAIKNVALIKFTAQSPSAVFVLHLLSSRYFDHIIGQKSRGGTQQFVSLGDLRSFPLPLPPSEFQAEFARPIAAVKKLKNLYLSSLSKSDTLFNSLLQRAFKGDLEMTELKPPKTRKSYETAASED